MHRATRACLAALMCMVPLSQAQAQGDFPSRSIRILVGFPPGGSTDVLARSLAQQARASLGQDIVILNKPGATGALAVTEVATSAPDGYTIGITPSTVMTLAHLFQSIRADLLESTDGLLMVGRQRIGMAASKASPYKSLKGFLDAARAAPGKLSIGVPGAGTLVDVVTRAILAHDRIEANVVPMQGDAPIVTALLGGHIAAGSFAAGGWAPQVRDGGLILLASMEADRVDVAPDVPTLLELGYPYRGDAIQHMFGPKGLPGTVRKRLTDAFLAATRSAAFIDIAKKNVLYDAKVLTGDDLDRHLLKDRADQGQLVDRIGLRRR